jgi:spermidine/putrescine transport system permease protein
MTSAAASAQGSLAADNGARLIERRRRRRLFGLLSPGVFWLLVFFALPMLSVLRASFDSFVDAQVVHNFTLANYERVFSESLYAKVLFKSLLTGLMVTVLCLGIGYPVAHFIARKARKSRELLFLGLIIPFWTSLVVRTYAWKILLGTSGVLNYHLMQLGIIASPLKILYSTTAVVIGLVHVFLPFMILPLYASIEKLDDSLEEAAQDMGANRIQTFIKVVLPLTMPGVATGCMLTFIMTVNSFLTPDLLGGPGNAMISNVIQSEFFQTFNWPFGSALSVVFMVFALGLVYFYNHLFKLDLDEAN